MKIIDKIIFTKDELNKTDRSERDCVDSHKATEVFALVRSFVELSKTALWDRDKEDMETVCAIHDEFGDLLAGEEIKTEDISYQVHYWLERTIAYWHDHYNTFVKSDHYCLKVTVRDCTTEGGLSINISDGETYTALHIRCKYSSIMGYNQQERQDRIGK